MSERVEDARGIGPLGGDTGSPERVGGVGTRAELGDDVGGVGALGGETATAAEGGERDVRGEPRPVLPVEAHLLTSLRGALAEDERVEAAYLFEAEREGLRRKLVVGLDVAPSTAREELERLARSLFVRLDPLVGAHTSLYFTRVEHDELLTELARETPPIYTRRTE